MLALSSKTAFQRSVPAFSSSRPVLLLAAGLVSVLLWILGAGRSPRLGWHSRDFSRHDDSESFRDIHNATLGFQKIFVINLRSRTDHRDAITLAAHFTGLQVEFVDGVTEVEEKALPPHDANAELSQPVLGAWRAHMNVARRIIEQNIQSALVLEDDVDWDLRLKANMQNFARASRLHVQPRIGTRDQYLDPTNPRVSQNEQPNDLSLSDQVKTPTTSPYGDLNRWDLFWLGHCGTRFPDASYPSVPLGRVAYTDDSVPESQHIGIQVGDDKLFTQYPNHTRVVHRAAFSVCSLAYAVSLPGARRMLYEFGVNRLSNAMDLMLNSMCEGIDGRKMRTCLSVQPELFQHHRAVGDKGTESEISSSHQGYNPTAYTRNVRWSTRLNFAKLVDGETDYIDSYPDGAEPAGYGY